MGTPRIDVRGHRAATYLVLSMTACVSPSRVAEPPATRTTTVAAQQEVDPDPGLARALQLLSIKLHQRQPTSAELATVRAALRRGDSPARASEVAVRSWLDAAAFRSVGDSIAAGNPTTRSLFVAELHVARTSSDEVYYLEHQNHVTPTGSPCDPADTVKVRPWWDLDHPLAICRASYRPDVVFDQVGYCGGQSDPATPVEPRAACGCGPLLLGCLPPDRDLPGLVDTMDRDARAEVVNTVAELATSGAT